MTMESSETVFPVPEGISSKQWPWKVEMEHEGGEGYLCVQRLLDFAHVEDLLRIDVLVGEIDGQTVNVESENCGDHVYGDASKGPAFTSTLN